jgi:hypothetical protein
VRSGKSSKYEENKDKSSLGCLRQKPIGALNLYRIGGNVKLKQFQNFSIKSWLGLERGQNMRKINIISVKKKEEKEELEEELRKNELKEQIDMKASTKFQINLSTNG